MRLDWDTVVAHALSQPDTHCERSEAIQRRHWIASSLRFSQ